MLQESRPPLADAVADAIRSACQLILTETDALTDALAGPALEAQNATALISDPSLIEEDRQLSRSELVQWLASNIREPGARVEPYMGPRTEAYVRDLISRGITPDFAGGWKVALAIGWRHWLEVCAATIPDRELLVEVLDVTAQSLVQYAIDSISALREVSLAAAMGNADAEAISLIQMIANGAPVAADFAESRLSYRLSRWHVGLVLWVDDAQQSPVLDEVSSAVRAGVPSRSALVARASATARWLWLSGAEPPDLEHVQRLLKDAGEVRAGVGRAGPGLEGFRATHQDALAAQALVTRLGSGRRLTAYADVELIDAVTKDRASAGRFVTKTLGSLAEADPALREALLTYLQCGFNTTRAAAKLYAHRNTVERRVSRANELSAVKIEDNPAHVSAALLVLEVAPDIAEVDRG